MNSISLVCSNKNCESRSYAPPNRGFNLNIRVTGDMVDDEGEGAFYVNGFIERPAFVDCTQLVCEDCGGGVEFMSLRRGYQPCYEDPKPKPKPKLENLVTVWVVVSGQEVKAFYEHFKALKHFSGLLVGVGREPLERLSRESDVLYERRISEEWHEVAVSGNYVLCYYPKVRIPHIHRTLVNE